VEFASPGTATAEDSVAMLHGLSFLIWVFDHMLLSLAGGPCCHAPALDLGQPKQLSFSFFFFLFCDDATC
jgi:hypothetical protein